MNSVLVGDTVWSQVTKHQKANEYVRCTVVNVNKNVFRLIAKGVPYNFLRTRNALFTEEEYKAMRGYRLSKRIGI